VCSDFKERRIVPTHYTIRSFGGDPGGTHLKSWLLETSADGKNWREVDRKEDNDELKGVLRWPDNNSMFRRLSCNRATSKE
jgi:hypothetical protein